MSAGCTRCYAERIAHRWGHDIWGDSAPRRFFGVSHWAEPERWNRRAEKAGVRRRVFCASMADVFEERLDLAPERSRLWALIKRTPVLDWLLLTKRPENVEHMAPWGIDWPTNVWLGTTVEDQRTAGIRIPQLQAAPARVRFLSCEPLLGRIDFDAQMLSGISWIITGGESGLHLLKEEHRDRALVKRFAWGWELREDRAVWLRSIRDQCQRAGVAYFHKQNGGPSPISGGRKLDGRTWEEFPEALSRMKT